MGQAYRIQSIALAHQLKLFDHHVDISDSRLNQGMTFTAWTLFNWESWVSPVSCKASDTTLTSTSLVAFSFLHPALVLEPPSWPLLNPSSDSSWFGEIWVKYPSNANLLPCFFGQGFLTKCHFRMIMAQFCQEAYSKGSKITLDIANRLLSRLEQWHAQLPKQLSPETIVCHINFNYSM